MHFRNVIVSYRPFLLPCEVPRILARWHLTFEHQAVGGEDLWPASYEGYIGLWTLCTHRIQTSTTPINTPRNTLKGSKEQFTFNAECSSLTLFWVEDSTCSSFSFALVRSSISHHTSHVVIVSRVVEFDATFVPDELPTRWDIYLADEWNRIPTVHHILIGMLYQQRPGLCIWGVDKNKNAIYIDVIYIDL